MSTSALAMAATVMLSLLAVVGDYFLKTAGHGRSPFTSWQFALGLALYAVSAFFAVFAFQHLKLAVVGAVYCVTMVLLLTVMGMVAFKEHLNLMEMVGLCLAVTSLFLLSRFA